MSLQNQIEIMLICYKDLAQRAMKYESDMKVYYIGACHGLAIAYNILTNSTIGKDYPEVHKLFKEAEQSVKGGSKE